MKAKSGILPEAGIQRHKMANTQKVTANPNLFIMLKSRKLAPCSRPSGKRKPRTPNPTYIPKIKLPKLVPLPSRCYDARGDELSFSDAHLRLNITYIVRWCGLG
ncbi:hypothetical protein CEXT_501681 [Caerostris extrusa]|uniref:Uncharacterized protein n=1 Tax=Caerostris extrusa TaxID=172846 RepID=A0AAV4XMF4_CAEEX|nr:hypothetical protein CEXT_501681 [Caerostris extrusa]